MCLLETHKVSLDAWWPMQQHWSTLASCHPCACKTDLHRRCDARHRRLAGWLAATLGGMCSAAAAAAACASSPALCSSRRERTHDWLCNCTCMTLSQTRSVEVETNKTAEPSIDRPSDRITGGMPADLKVPRSAPCGIVSGDKPMAEASVVCGVRCQTYLSCCACQLVQVSSAISLLSAQPGSTLSEAHRWSHICSPNHRVTFPRYMRLSH